MTFALQTLPPPRGPLSPPPSELFSINQQLRNIHSNFFCPLKNCRFQTNREKKKKKKEREEQHKEISAHLSREGLWVEGCSGLRERPGLRAPHLPGRAAPLAPLRGEGAAGPRGRREGPESGAGAEQRRGLSNLTAAGRDGSPAERGPTRRDHGWNGMEWDGLCGEAHGDGSSPQTGSWAPQLRRKRKSRG